MNSNHFQGKEREYWLDRCSGKISDNTGADSPYRKRDFLSLTHYSAEELEGLMQFAERIKSGEDKKKYLLDKNVGLMFGVASTRTRISFNVGVNQLGGHSDYYNTRDMQLVYHESMADTIEVMNRYIDGLVVRLYDMNEYGKGHETLELLAQRGSIPIINGLDDQEHPCQVLGDILTIKEKFGEDYKNKKVVFTWGYSWRQKSPGVPHSMMVAASILGMNITYAYPRGFDLNEEYVEFAERAMESSGGRLEFTNDLKEASEDADVIYVKSWKALRMDGEEDQQIRQEVKDQWCVSDEHFKLANPGAVFMNCLPIIRGEQATADVIDGEHSIIYDEAENRLHIQKAIMSALIR